MPTIGPVCNDDQNRDVEHLIELGYVDPQDLAAKQAVEQCRADYRIQSSGLFDGRRPTFTGHRRSWNDLRTQHPDWLNSRSLLAEAYYRANQRQSARAEIDWLMCQGVEQPQLYCLSGAVEFADRQFDLALEELRCAGRAGVKLPGLNALEGNIHLRRRDIAAAEAAFRSAIDFEGPTHQSLDGLAAVNLHRQRYEEAAISALDALEKDMRFGRAHYHLAVALLHLDKPHEALRALESWAAVEPQSAAPFRWMAHVSERSLGDRTSGSRLPDTGTRDRSPPERNAQVGASGRYIRTVVRTVTPRIRSVKLRVSV